MPILASADVVIPSSARPERTPNSPASAKAMTRVRRSDQPARPIATTRAVVWSVVSVFLLDYVITALLTDVA